MIIDAINFNVSTINMIEVIHMEVLSTIASY